MTEGFSYNNDVLFTFEQVALFAQENVALNKDQKKALRKLSRAEKESRRQEFLKRNEAEKKSLLFLKIQELEKKVEDSDLPGEAKTKILAMTQKAKTHDMTFLYDVQNEIKIIRAEVQAQREAEERRAANQQQNTAATTTAMAAGMVIGGVALAPFVQVRYNKEEYDKRTKAYYEEKIVNDLVAGRVDTLTPTPVYQTKKGSLYSQRHYQIKDRQKTEIQNLVAAQIQEKQKKAGLPVQTTEAIIQNLEHLHPVKQRAATRVIYQENPALEKKHKEEDKEVASAEILRGIIRNQRKEQAKTIALLQKEQKQLLAGGDQKSILRAKALEKKIADRQETAAKLGLFMENFDTVLQANNTTANDLVKSATTKGQVSSGSIVDLITTLNMAGFQARQPAKAEAKGLSKRLAEISAPTQKKKIVKKAVATAVKRVEEASKKAGKEKPKAEMRLVGPTQKGLSKRLKTIKTQETVVKKATRKWTKEETKAAFSRKVYDLAG